MRNFIGNVLIGLATFLTTLRNVMFFILVAGIIFGILMITIIAFAELIGRAAPTQQIQMPLDLFGRWYWEMIVFVIGSLTMWQGIKKMFEADKKESETLDGWNENPKY